MVITFYLSIIYYNESGEAMINFFKEKVQLTDKDNVIKLHCRIKAYEKGFHLTDADINCLVELYNVGYNSTFFKNCIAKKYYESEQTVRNAVAKMTGYGILSYKKRGERFINPEFIPTISNDKVIFQYLVGNL